MSDAPACFIPGVEANDLESGLISLAAMARRPVPEPRDRVYSITFMHDGEEWTATVGEKLRGVLNSPPQSGRKLKPPIHKSDSATVLVIFPGSPYVVVTNKGIDGTRSAWENPFYAGQPLSHCNFRTSV